MAASIAAPLERRLGEIPGVTEITSTSSTGSASIVVQFDIDRPDRRCAAHDVQAAINAAYSDLPSDLPTRPYYRKFNPAEAPILTLSLTSDTLNRAQLFDAADTILAQRLSQIEGVSQVQVNGAEKPAVRVRLHPAALRAAGLEQRGRLHRHTQRQRERPHRRLPGAAAGGDDPAQRPDHPGCRLRLPRAEKRQRRHGAAGRRGRRCWTVWPTPSSRHGRARNRPSC